MRVLFLLLMVSFCVVEAQTSMTLAPQTVPQPQFLEPAAGVYEIKSAMPVIARPTKLPAADEVALQFSSFCLGGVEKIAVLSGPDFDSQKAQWLPSIGHSETWTAQSFELAPFHLAALRAGASLRLDLYLKPKASMQLKGLSLGKKPTTSGLSSAADIAALREALVADAAAQRPARVTEVIVGKDAITIRGERGKLTGLSLAAVPMHATVLSPNRWQSLRSVPDDGNALFTLTVPRYEERQGRKIDLLISSWQLCQVVNGIATPVSHARYADEIDCRSPELPASAPRNKKGLGGWHTGFPISDDLATLGISSITVNCMMHHLLSLKPIPGASARVWQGRTYYLAEARWAGMDQIMLAAAKQQIMVSAILLIPNPRQISADARIMAHPGCTAEGTFAMPNVCDEAGLDYYGAVLDAFYERYSRADGKYGRVHHSIIHNEVDAGIVWTNAGQIPLENFFDLYYRSMRLSDLIARQYDPHHRPFISLTHHWMKTNPAWYPSRRLLESLSDYCQRQGDFPWALAYHPYPQDLRKPRTWEDDQPTFRFDTPKITPRNLEVLDAFMKEPAMLYRGKDVRPVHLSENGFNSPDYQEQTLRDQAAGMAYAWKKIQQLSSIQAWQYHNWVDNRHEGGLRLGLRKFPDEAGDPFGKKPIYHLYQALGTPQEDAVCAPYLPVIGKASWQEIFQPIER